MGTRTDAGESPALPGIRMLVRRGGYWRLDVWLGPA